MGAPYVSAVELQEAPTGINWSSIPVKSATSAQQLQEITNLVRRATSWVDSFCRQSMQATTQTSRPRRIDGVRARLQPDGIFYLLLDQFPVVSVSKVEYSPDAATWSTLSGWTAANFDQQAILVVPGAASTVPITGAPGFPYGWLRATYVAGFANAVLTADALAAATQIVVDDPTGILAGDTLTIYDDTVDTPVQETVTVDAGYVAGSTTVTLAAALANAHASGAHVSAIPEDVREATILAATSYVGRRGRDSVTPNAAAGARVSRATQSLPDWQKQAQDLLNNRRLWL